MGRTQSDLVSPSLRSPSLLDGQAEAALAKAKQAYERDAVQVWMPIRKEIDQRIRAELNVTKSCGMPCGLRLAFAARPARDGTTVRQPKLLVLGPVDKQAANVHAAHQADYHEDVLKRVR